MTLIGCSSFCNSITGKIRKDVELFDDLCRIFNIPTRQGELLVDELRPSLRLGFGHALSLPDCLHRIVHMARDYVDFTYSTAASCARGTVDAVCGYRCSKVPCRITTKAVPVLAPSSRARIAARCRAIHEPRRSALSAISIG